MTLLIVCCLIVFFAVAYAAVLGPMHLRWGALNEETEAGFPGDEIVTKPNFNATLGISIKAPPDEIWKWIIQIGSKRAGCLALENYSFRAGLL